MQKPSLFAVVSLLMAAVLGTASVSAAEKFDPNPKHQLPRTDAKAPPQPPTNRALVHIDTAAPSRTYSRMIFGGFLEHFDNQIYGGVFEPGSPLADKQWAIALVNRHPTDTVAGTVRMKGIPLDGTYGATVLAGESPDAYNDIEHPDQVAPKEVKLTFKDGIADLPPRSLMIIRVATE